MKYLILFFLSFCSISALACSCYNESSFCNYIQSDYFAATGMVCIVEATGNVTGNYDFSAAEVKIVELLYGQIEPGQGNYLNNDSTIWILGGQGAICYESAFIFNNPGEQFVVAPLYGAVYNFNNPPETGYALFLCTHDVFRYTDPMIGPIINDNYFYPNQEYDIVTVNQLPNVVNNCSNCLVSLTLSTQHNFPSVYNASSNILSTATVNNNVTYKANDRITLFNGFKTNKAYNFKIVTEACN